MTSESKTLSHPERKPPPWLPIAKVLLLALFIAGLFLLGLSMTQHRFFRGGAVNRHGVVVQ